MALFTNGFNINLDNTRVLWYIDSCMEQLIKVLDKQLELLEWRIDQNDRILLEWGHSDDEYGDLLQSAADWSTIAAIRAQMAFGGQK